MTIVRYNPFREMEEMLDRYSRSMGQRTAQTSGDREVVTSSDWTPAVDISENGKEFLIKVEVPEVKKEDVKVTVDNGVITIKGERKLEKEEHDQKHHRIERYYGSFARSFSLPENVKERDIKAEFKDGMLYLHLLKSQPEQPKFIEINID